MTRRLVIAMTVAGLSASCTHTEDEWKAQLAKYEQVVADNASKDKQLAEAKQRVSALEADLARMGLQTSKLEVSLEERDRALAQYKARAAQLAAIKARFELLRRKLEAFTHLGLTVTIRHNRMIISLPGDVLFDTGKDTLRKEGREILGSVATVIKNDPHLVNRDFQIAGHTDNQPLQGGPFKDNWGLSVMRARSVLVFLVGKGGILPRQHWSAAGFADTDPVANNGTRDGQQKNRRCELIVVPEAEEMLDLRALVEGV